MLSRFHNNTGTQRTDRQTGRWTDGRTDRIAISISRVRRDIMISMFIINNNDNHENDDDDNDNNNNNNTKSQA